MKTKFFNIFICGLLMTVGLGSETFASNTDCSTAIATLVEQTNVLANKSNQVGQEVQNLSNFLRGDYYEVEINSGTTASIDPSFVSEMDSNWRKSLALGTDMGSLTSNLQSLATSTLQIQKLCNQ